MAYTKFGFTETTPADPPTMDHLDQGIKDVDDDRAAHAGASNPHSGSASVTALNGHTGATGGAAHDQMARVATGTYVGDGTDGRAFNVGFQPSLVHVIGQEAGTGMAMSAPGVLGDTARGWYRGVNGEIVRSSDERLRPTLTTSGFEINDYRSTGDTEIQLNRPDHQYAWVAYG